MCRSSRKAYRLAYDEKNHALIVGRSVNRGAFKLT
jgi:hypothetical protein